MERGFLESITRDEGEEEKSPTDVFFAPIFLNYENAKDYHRLPKQTNACSGLLSYKEACLQGILLFHLSLNIKNLAKNFITREHGKTWPRGQVLRFLSFLRFPPLSHLIKVWSVYLCFSTFPGSDNPVNSALVSCRLGLGCLVVLLLHPHHELTPRPRYLLGQLWACEELLTDLPFTTHQPELKSAFSLTSLCTHFLKSLCLPYTKTLFKEAIKVCANKQLPQKIMYFF